jgi:16S rRNA (guanine966-N2)-methyltransferase
MRIVRISAGTAKGRRIGYRKAFRKKDGSAELRPTSSKVREALFDIIRDRVPDAVFLDLYAGSGGVGLEALSRGASKVVFVESDRSRVTEIRQLLERFDFLDRGVVVNSDGCDFMRKEANRGHRYGIIFLDPPYVSDELMKVLPLVGEVGILDESGLVIAEHFFKTTLPEMVNKLRLIKSYKYGDTVLTVYGKVKAQEEVAR